MATRAIIAGAGIGGLSAALALAQAGCEVSIFERSPELQEYGAGLQLTPNATRVLAQLGALEEVRAIATAPRAVRVLRGKDNAELSQLPLDEAELRWGAPYLVVHRADLQRALAEATQRGDQAKLTLGAEIASVEAGGRQVEVGLDRGGVRFEERADALIGADGLRSRVRETLKLGAADGPQFIGRVAFRATVEVTEVDSRWGRPDVFLRLGPKAHFVHYPLRGGSVVNLVAVVESTWLGDAGQQPWDGDADRPALERAFADWSPETRRLIGAASNWRAWPLFSRPQLRSFAYGRIALVGDAAHPMAPFLAQGAAQAIEDAGSLGRRLTGADSVAAALAAYSRDRVARATRVQNEALKQGRVYHMSGPFAVARDAAIRFIGGHGLGERYDWLYGA